MLYNINDIVKIKDSNDLKIISEIEVISNIVIYYMSDNTSYSETQIIKFDIETQTNLCNKCEIFNHNNRIVFSPKNKSLECVVNELPEKNTIELVNKFTDIDKFTDGFVKLIERKVEADKKKEQLKKINQKKKTNFISDLMNFIFK